MQMNIIYNLVIIVLVVLLLISLFYGKVRKKALSYMAGAELNIIDSTRIVGIIDTIEAGPWDDRMIEVIASLIYAIPFFRFIPRKWAVSFLHKLVQKTFDECRTFVRSKVNTKVAAKLKIDSVNIPIPKVDDTEKIKEELKKIFNDR